MIFKHFVNFPETRISLFKSGKKWILARRAKNVFSQNAKNENFWNGKKISENFVDFLEKKISEKDFVVGFFGFDFGKKEISDSQIPRAEFVFFDEKMEIQNPDFQTVSKDFSVKNWKSNFPKSFWKAGFDATIKNIFAGNFYQINLTRLFSADFSGNARALFCFLNAHFDAPRAAFFAGENFEIASMSPETFVDFSEQKMCTKPIKGTAARGKNAISDRKKKKCLLNSKKEAAELSMITDLLRNDLVQNAIAGSTKVEKWRAIQKNPNVFHTFSEISATRKSEISPIRALAKMLPAGSVSGCPKKIAVEKIAEIEPHDREIFCGVFGFFDGKKTGESSVLIRTFLRKNKKLFFQAGGGITADSKKMAELKEIDAKSKNFFKLAEN